MATQLKLKLREDDIEMFCPSCWNDETFTKSPNFKNYVCCGCGFPIEVEFVEFVEVGNTGYWQTIKEQSDEQ